MVEMKMDEMDRKIGLALWDAGMCIHSTLTGYLVEAEDGDQFMITIEKHNGV